MWFLGVEQALKKITYTLVVLSVHIRECECFLFFTDVLTINLQL